MPAGPDRAISGKGQGTPFDQARVVRHNAPQGGKPVKETSNLQVVATVLVTGVSAAQAVVEIVVEEPLEE
jgi:hypothetical protein